MRITRDNLLTQARENTSRLTAKDRGIICVYIVGSLLREDPFIGKITDIDLVCVHDRPVKNEREVIRLNPEITLDLAHYEQEVFEPARKLRTDAWIGGAFETVPLVLHDPLRWYDFTRASATAQFWRAENVAARVRSFLVPARKAWSDLEEGNVPQGIKRIQSLLEAYKNLANGVVCLTGVPLPIRRLMSELPARCEQAGLTGFAGELLQLFTSDAVNDDNFAAWVDGYVNLFESLSEVNTAPTSLLPYRRNYYEKAIRAIYPEHPAASVWIMLRSWTKAAAVLPKAGQAYKDWQALCRQLELDAGNLQDRLEALDHLLDVAEEAADRLQK